MFRSQHFDNGARAVATRDVQSARLATLLGLGCWLWACGPSGHPLRTKVTTEPDADVTTGPDDAGGGGSAGPGGATTTGLGGSGGATMVDAAAIVDVAPDVAVDAPQSEDVAADVALIRDATDARPDGMYWQVYCPTDAGESRTACCTLYCGCMARNCASQEPADCMNTCVTVKNWDLACRIHNCFLSISPNSPQDHDSHCGHADGKNGKCTNT